MALFPSVVTTLKLNILLCSNMRKSHWRLHVKITLVRITLLIKTQSGRKEVNCHFCDLDVSMREYGTSNNPYLPCWWPGDPMFRDNEWSGKVEHARQAFLSYCAGDWTQGHLHACTSPPPISSHPQPYTPVLGAADFQVKLTRLLRFPFVEYN